MSSHIRSSSITLSLSMNELDPDLRRQLRMEIAGYDDHQVIGVEKLSVLLDTTKGNIYRMLYRRGPLPPPLSVFGRRKVWLMGTVRAWLRAQSPASDSSSASTAPLRKGRPRRAN